jgi:hypothetical protein
MGLRRKVFGGVMAATTLMVFSSLVMTLPSANAATRGVKVSHYANKLASSVRGWCTDTAPNQSVPLSGCDGMLNDWGTIDVVKSSFSNGGGYAPAVPAPSGNGKHYARVSGAPQSTSQFWTLPPGITEGQTGCSTPGEEACTGPFILFGNGANVGKESIFPANGFTSSIKIYLDTAWAGADPGQVVDWDVSLNSSAGAFAQDFMFNLCSTAAGGGGFYISSSNNAGGCTTGPFEETASGWYTFTHTFYWNAGQLDVQFTVTNAANTPVFQYLETESSVPGIGTLTSPTQLGGPNYGWLPDEDVLGLPLAQESLMANAVQP